MFIGGLHRSGTSLVHRCLAAHPEVTGFRNTGVPEDEGQHLQSVFPTARDVGGPGRFGFSPGGFLDEHSSLVSPENREQLLAEWGRYWDPSKPVRVEKSPPTLVRTRFLQALFPEASFVLVLRHPIAASLATQRWTKLPVEELLRHWLVCHRRFLRDRPHLRRSLVIRYEALVQSPAETLSALFRFVGVRAQAADADCVVAPGINRTYIERWRQTTSAAQQIAVVLRYEMALRRLGYSLIQPDTDRMESQITS